MYVIHIMDLRNDSDVEYLKCDCYVFAILAQYKEMHF